MKKKANVKKLPLKLMDIIQQVWWEDVANELVGIHPEFWPKVVEYQEVFEKLKEMEPMLSEDRIVVEFERADLDVWGPYYSAYVRKGPNDDESALAFTPWADCLGMEVVQEPFDGLPLERIAALCLYEMTVSGFTEEKIREEERAIRKEVEAYMKKRQSGEELGWGYPQYTMKDSLRRLRKWLRWGGIAREYFGQNGSWFVDRFIGNQAPEFYEELDRCTLKAALKEIARDLLRVAGEL